VATCNQCKVEYYLDWQNGGRKLELDKKSVHRCVIATTSASSSTIPIAQNDRERKMEELALLKIDAISSIGENIEHEHDCNC
jgi:hypothetical protein